MRSSRWSRGRGLTVIHGQAKRIGGSPGSVIAGPASGDPTVLMSGVYARAGVETHLLAAPRWNEIVLEGARGGPVRRVLDLHAGVLHQQIGSANGRFDALLFSSLARPGTPSIRARGPIRRMRLAGSLEPPPGVRCEEGEDDGFVWMRVTGSPRRSRPLRTVTCADPLRTGCSAGSRRMREHRTEWPITTPRSTVFGVRGRTASMRFWLSTGGRGRRGGRMPMS